MPTAGPIIACLMRAEPVHGTAPYNCHAGRLYTDDLADVLDEDIEALRSLSPGARHPVARPLDN